MNNDEILFTTIASPIPDPLVEEIFTRIMSKEITLTVNLFGAEYRHGNVRADAFLTEQSIRAFAVYYAADIRECRQIFGAAAKSERLFKND